ncbi:MAG TPA: GNAT family N-acetyltransferase [Devosia sp.]|nr:GNAT family N-acetyltransferase [Devosia sp.]
MTPAIRPLAPRELDAVAALMGETLALPMNANVLTRDFLLAPGFRYEHLLVADNGGELAGFVLAPRHDPLAPEKGWIAAFGVSAAHRRQGIATALLRRAIADMRAEGVAAVDVADVPVRYLLPGVDRQAFPGAFELLSGLGFASREEVASMGLPLDREFPTAPEIRPVELGELPLVRDFFAGWPPGWWEHMERSLLQKILGDAAPAGILCWWEAARPLGVVHYRGNRFGPLAVGDATRGRGIGAALTLAGLAAIKAAGFGDAYFLVGREEVQPFYKRLGFSVRRRFARMTLSL